MLLKITICITALVLINFILLKFSVNKTTKKSKITKMPVVFRPEKSFEVETQTLAPTGS